MRAAARIALSTLAGMALALLAPSTKAEEPEEDPVVGEWGTQGMSAKVKVAPCAAGGICGTILWLWEPVDHLGRPKTDGENPDVGLRDRSLIGVQILSGFRRRASGEFDGGTVYNPEDGRTYDATLRLQGTDSLIIEGCFLFICRRQVWRRASSICERP
jgi:uncharacterized protein (DUF2147 family)